MHLTSQLPAESPARDETLLRGCFRILFLYDVAEAFDMNKLRGCLGPNAEPVKQVFPRRTPEYIRFEQVPIIEPAQPITLATGDHVLCSVKCLLSPRAGPIPWTSNHTRANCCASISIGWRPQWSVLQPNGCTKTI